MAHIAFANLRQALIVLRDAATPSMRRLSSSARPRILARLVLSFAISARRPSFSPTRSSRPAT